MGQQRVMGRVVHEYNQPVDWEGKGLIEITCRTRHTADTGKDQRKGAFWPFRPV